MLKFRVVADDSADPPLVLRNAHLLGADNIAVRGSIHLDGSIITCDKRAAGPAALALQVHVGDVGEVTVQTCLLPDRDEPYLLYLELARHRLMLLLAKQEDWMMFDLAPDHPAMRRLHLARTCFVKALNAIDDTAQAQRLARESLAAATDASEELALAHAESVYTRRQNGNFRRAVLGCGAALDQTSETIRKSLSANFDYVALPTRWRRIEPQEQQHDWSLLDNWAEWACRTRMAVLAGPVVSFCPRCSPDWLGVMDHDYETIRDIIYEHVERVVSRYRNVVTLWNVVSGIHTNSQLNLSLEQLTDLTRMAVMLVKKIQPTAKTLVEITHPFGEYYATNPRSIPPMIYADMVLQSGMPVDAFGVRLLMGQPVDGQYTRDLMQTSALLDRFSGLGKPLHLTAVAVPSEPVELDLAKPPSNHSRSGPHHPPDDNSGYWRKPWSPLVQSHWLEAFYNIALSKPFVDSIAWLDLADHENAELPNAGLAMSNLKAKGAFHRVTSIRKALHAEYALGGE
jgi:GH35 family endo-1,4-beta-xylanase